MWQVADEISVLDPSVRLHMLVTRGQGHIALSTYWMVRTLATPAYLRAKGEIDVLHVNLSKREALIERLLFVRSPRNSDCHTSSTCIAGRIGITGQEQAGR